MSYCQDAYIEALQKENAALKEHAIKSADLVSGLTLENHELKTIIGQYKEKESQSKNKVVINVETEGIDEALEKMKELAGICEKVGALQQRTIKAQETTVVLPKGARVINMGLLQSCIGINADDFIKQVEEVIRKKCVVSKGNLR